MIGLVETPLQTELRSLVRSVVDRIEPAAVDSQASFDDRLVVDRALARERLLGLTWPQEFGGRGLTSMDALVVDDELARAGITALSSPSRFGVNMLGPSLMVHGTPKQQASLLPDILSAETIWCQGFSEPDAGSDLAGVQTRATPRDGGFVLRGRKIWTTQADRADRCFVLARTDEGSARHRGLSMLLVPLDQPGIAVSPIQQTTGQSVFTEVVFDDVFVPAADVLGAPGTGWAVAMTTLTAERGFGQVGRYTQFRSEWLRFRGTAAEDTDSEGQVGELAARLLGVRALALRIAAGGDDPDQRGITSVAKLWWSETHQALSEAMLLHADTAGDDFASAMRIALECGKETIYGGTSQIQKNIIAERVLGLPKEQDRTDQRRGAVS